MAGDESQTLHPSGFDWGVTNDFLRQRFDCNPRSVRLESQRRCPGELAQLVENSWDMYRHYLPEKHMLPNEKKAAVPGDEQTTGTLRRWRTNPALDWTSVLEQLGEYPDLAIVDLDDQFSHLAGGLTVEASTIADRLCYSPTSIKGLDRKTILIVGLPTVLERLRESTESIRKPRAKDHDLVALETRNQIDAIRVALSRSTAALFLIESAAATLDAAPAGLSDVAVVEWDEVQRCLRDLYQDLDTVERIAALLNVAAESMSRGDYERAVLQNAEAQTLLILAGRCRTIRTGRATRP